MALRIFVGIFQLAGRIEDGIDIKITFMEFSQLIDLRLAIALHVELEEGFFIHLVFLYQIRIEAVNDTVRQNPEPCFRDMEITEKLPVMGIQILFPVFAFDQYGRCAVLVNGIIDFLAFLDADIAGELRNDLRRIENIVSQRLDKRQNECCFRSLLG